MIFNQIMKSSFKRELLLQLCLLAILICCSEYAFAGTGGTELQTIYDKTEGIITGYGGKMIVISSFIVALISAITSSVKVLIPSAVVGTVAAIGPSIVTSGVTALI